MKILIVEDEKDLAESIIGFLQNENYRCEAAYTAEEAIERISLHDYDCILLDITLPDGNGLTVLERLKLLKKNDGVIIVSARNSIDDKIRGLNLGADDYIAKPFHLSEVSARITAVIRRKQFAGNNEIVFHEIQVDLQGKKVSVKGKPVDLTKKEFELLLFLVSNRNRVVSKNAIAEHLSGDEADVFDNFDFIYAHMKNLKKKLADASCPDYIKTVYGLGYKAEV